MATLSNSGLVKLRAGADHTALTGAQYDEFIEETEGQIVADTGVNWLDVYSGLNDDFKKILQGAVSARAANGAIMNDPLALGGLAVATTMVNQNLDVYDRAVAKLKDTNVAGAFGGTQMTS